MEVQSRTKAAIEIIEQGQPFRAGNLLLSKPDKGSLAVTGWTQYIHLESLTKDFALKELAAIKEDFKDLALHPMNGIISSKTKSSSIIWLLMTVARQASAFAKRKMEKLFG